MDFEERLDELTRSTSSSQKKSIHFKSISNFIEYYPLVKKERRKITELLEEYFNIIELKNYSLTEEESKALFNLFISKLGLEYYRKHFDFTNYLGNILLIFILIFFNLLIWISFHSKTATSIFLFISLCMVTNYFFKMAKHKMYGFRY